MGHTPLDRVRELNYDHHRRMTEMHEHDQKTGNSTARADVDDQSYRSLLRHVPGGRTAILELGAASGKQWPLLTGWLTPGGTMHGIDLYEPLVLVAQQIGRNIQVGYVEAMPFEDATFDLVCSRHVMEHLGDLPKGILEILRVTKPGGWIAHVTPNMAVDNEPAHLNHYNLGDWSLVWRASGLQVLSATKHPYHGGEVHIVGRKL
jgi:ubiquinone/menaquinone biosynthesis C-methylase UbiE